MVNMVCFLFNGNFVRALENDGDEKLRESTGDVY